MYVKVDSSRSACLFIGFFLKYVNELPFHLKILTVYESFYICQLVINEYNTCTYETALFTNSRLHHCSLTELKV